MGRHSGSACDDAPDEGRPWVDGNDWPDAGPEGEHSPVTRRQVLGILGVAGAAAACTGVASVVANKPDTVPGAGTGSMPAGKPAKPVGLAAGAAAVTAPPSDQMTAKQYDKTGYRASKPPQIQPKPLLQPPTLLSLDQNLHWARRITYGVTPTVMRELVSTGREAYLEKQLTPAATDPVVDAVAERYPLLRMSPPQLKQLFEAEEDKPENQRLDYMATEDQLVEMKIIRSAWSDNQLLEKVHDVWAAFLHVPVGEKTRLMTADFDRAVIRRFALGRFADMLKAAMFHPAMLVYLDQPQSNGNAKGDDGRPQVNENLGRELLELFSVGALDPITGKPNYDGKVDIRQAAYALTGLTVDNETLRYRFDPDLRYRGPLKVLSWRHANTNPALGPQVVQSLVNYLAYHPATARHVAEQFARHFVSDSPRPQLITALDAEFTKARTDIRPMLRALFRSEDFRKSVGQKYRTMWEWLPATLRGTAARLDQTAEDAIDERRGTFNGVRDLRYLVEQNGGGPHGRGTPDGQPDYQGAWLSGKAQLDKWNASAILADNGWRGITVPEATAIAGRATTQAQLVTGLNQRVVGQQVQPGFATAVHQFIGTPSTTPAGSVQNLPQVLRTVLTLPHLNYT